MIIHSLGIHFQHWKWAFDGLLILRVKTIWLWKRSPSIFGIFFLFICMTECACVGGYSNLVLLVQPNSCWFCSCLHSNSWGLSLQGRQNEKGERKSCCLIDILCYTDLFETLNKEGTLHPPKHLADPLQRSFLVPGETEVVQLPPNTHKHTTV